MDTNLGGREREKEREKRIDTLPIQPAMNEHIIKHSRDCKPSRGEGEKGKLAAKTQGTREKDEQRKDYPVDNVGGGH